MHATVLIILAAVVAVIVVVVLLGMRYLRADDYDDDLEDAPAQSGPSRGYSDDHPRERARIGALQHGRAARAEPERQRVGAARAGSARQGASDRSEDRSGRDRGWQADSGPGLRGNGDAAASGGSRRPLDRHVRDRDVRDPRAADRPERDGSDRDWSDRRDRSSRHRSLDDRDRDFGSDRDDLTRLETANSRDSLDRRPVTGPNSKPQARRPDGTRSDVDGSLPAVKPRAAKSQAKSKRDDDGDWPSSEWDELSDVDYWAELASGKPLPESASQAGSSASRGRSANRAANERLPQRGGSDRDRPERNRSERGRPERAGSERGRNERGGSRRDTDSGSSRPGRPGGIDRGIDRGGAGITPSGPNPESVLAGLSRPAETASGRSRRDELSDTGSRRAAFHGMDRPLPDRPDFERSLPAGSRNQAPLDDDPLTSPSFPRIETEDGRSYRRSRSASGSGSSGGQTGANSHPLPAYSAATGPHSLPAHEGPEPLGYQEHPSSGYPIPAYRGSGGYPAPTSGTSGGYQIPPAAQHQLPKGGYPTAPRDSGGHVIPGSGSDYPAAGSGGYPMPPVARAGGYAADSYSLPRGDSYEVRSPAPGGYAQQPPASYPAESDPGNYSPGARSGPYALPSGGLNYSPGSAEQAVSYPTHESGPHSSPHVSAHSGPYQQPEIPAGYQSGGYQPGYQAADDFVRSVPAGFPGQNGAPAASYSPYPPALPPVSPAVQGTPGLQSGTAALGSGYGQDYVSGQQGTSPYPDAAYQPYDPPGYASPRPSTGYPAADPYAVDPYGSTGYGNGGY